jgi:hypothetical protein
MDWTLGSLMGIDSPIYAFLFFIARPKRARGWRYCDIQPYDIHSYISRQVDIPDV